MTNIAILTLHFYDNYGSVLQAYALKTAIERIRGCNAAILPFRPELPKYNYFTERELLLRYAEKQDEFRAFRTRFLDVKEPYANDVTMCDGNYDAYVVGSDIVWGQEFSGLNGAYFLDFVPNARVKVAYAPSVVFDNTGSTENDALFREHLRRFDAISARERSAIPVLRQFTDREVVIVLDPTLLLTVNDYRSIAKRPNSLTSEPYLLSYFLTHDPAAVDYTNIVAKRFGLKVVHYWADYPRRVMPPDADCFAFCDPLEFLAYVDNATLVLTNSYHGTAFSIIFGKPFYTYTVNRGLLSRVTDLTAMLGLESREFSTFVDIQAMDNTFDFTAANSKLDVLRTNSESFLRNAVSLSGGNNV
jgi:hypothetical protein